MLAIPYFRKQESNINSSAQSIGKEPGWDTRDSQTNLEISTSSTCSTWDQYYDTGGPIISNLRCGFVLSESYCQSTGRICHRCQESRRPQSSRKEVAGENSPHSLKVTADPTIYGLSVIGKRADRDSHVLSLDPCSSFFQCCLKYESVSPRSAK